MKFKTIRMTIKTTEGPRPPASAAPTETLAVDAAMMMRMLGGIRDERVDVTIVMAAA
jgi:hypothetical protein